MNQKTARYRRASRSASLVRMEALESRQLLSTFQVTDNSDAGPGSFRQAIIDSNNTPGSNSIDFDIPGTGVQTISLSTPLPAVNNPAIIDATTQPGYAGTPLIELNGANIFLPGVTPPTPQPGVIGLVLSGGASTVKGLTIDRFTGAGIFASGGGGNTIASNFIGTDPTATFASGNGADGIVISSRNNTIGGDTAADRNVISGNTGRGIFLGTSGNLPGRNIVEGNLIGTDISGNNDLGNGLAGVDVESSGNSIGGTTASLGNTIDFNGRAGVQVGSFSGQSGVNQNRIVNNSIFANVGLGIDIGNDGVTFNNPGFTFGPNNHQTFPNLTSAYSAPAGGTTVEGTLSASPNSTYTINYYQSPSGDPSGFGQGQTPIASRTVVTDSTGFVDVTTTLATSIPVNQVVTATATDANGNTSEFSRALVVSSIAQSHLDVFGFTASATVNVPQTYTFSVENSGPSKATNVLFTDILPQGATFLNGTTSQGGALVDTNGTVTTNLGSLADNTSATITLTYTLSTTGFATNTATVTADQPDPNPVGRTLTQNIQVFPAPPTDLNISGAASPNPVQVDNDLTYTFLVTNLNFNNSATGVTVTDVLPQNVTFVSATSSQGTATFSDGTVTASLGMIPGQANATVTVVVRPTGAGLLSNTATVKGNESDFNQLNNSVTVLSTVTPAPSIDLAVAVTSAPVPAQVGQGFTYVVNVANFGNATATNVSLTNLLPDGISIASIKPSQGTTSLNGSVLSAALGTLGPGTQAAVTIVVKPGAPGLIIDSASVSADQTDFNIGNNYSTSIVPVLAQQVGPTLTNQRLTVSNNRITSIVLTFSSALDPTLAVNPANYAIEDLGSKSSLTASGPKVPFGPLAFDPNTRSVTIVPEGGLAIGRFYKLVLNGPGAPGLTDIYGNVLDGEQNGLQNSAYVALIGRGTITRPRSIQIGASTPHPNPTKATTKSTKPQSQPAHPKVVVVHIQAAKPKHASAKGKAHA